MRKTISSKWLERMDACLGIRKMFKNQKARDTERILRLLAEQHRWAWAGWLSIFVMNKRESHEYDKIVIGVRRGPWRAHKTRIESAYKILGIKNVKW